MRLQIDLLGDRVVDRELLKYVQRMENLAPAFEHIADEIADIEHEQFDTEGKAGGATWAQLSPAYLVWKQQRYPDKPILQRTGALVESLTRTPLGVQQISARSATLGTDVPYAIYHQTGTPRMPARAPFHFTELNKRDIVKVLQRYLHYGAAMGPT